MQSSRVKLTLLVQGPGTGSLERANRVLAETETGMEKLGDTRVLEKTLYVAYRGT